MSRYCSLAAVAFATLALMRLAVAQTASSAETAPSGSATSGDAALAIEQGRLADKYKELERLVLRMAEVTQSTDPKRAALLRQAFAQSKERQINLQLEDLVALLEKEQLYQAAKGQDAVQKDLNQLLQLLLSGDRDKQIPSERAQLKKFIERINKLIREQQGIQGETEGQGDVEDLRTREGRVADKTGELHGDVKKFDTERLADEEKTQGATEKPESEGDKPEKTPSAPGAPSGEPKQGEGEPEEGEGEPKEEQQEKGNDKPTPSSDKPSGEPSPGEPSGKQSDKPAEGSPQPSQGGSPSESGEGKPGQTGESQQGENKPKQDESPARRRIRAAEDRMRQAQKRLDESQRKSAADEQQKAIEELKQAKAELEEILRQLREEEIERVLAMLESRFRKMLKMQTEVYEGTVRLDKIPDDERDRELDIQSGKLSRDEAAIAVECDRTLALLREEGSSVAFPESVEQMREDIEQVTARLARASVGEMTQGIEQDIIRALEEMIAALQQAQKDQRQRAGQGGGGGGDDDQALVDKIAELKMIRALQMRVNTRTQRYSKLLDDGAEQADEPELVDALKRLGQRQERIYRTTRDIVVGKNQ